MKCLAVILVSFSVTINLDVVLTSSNDGHHHQSNPIDSKMTSSLNLSPWELHVLSDLYMELSLLTCPSINRVSVRTLKRFIALQVQDADRDPSTVIETEAMNSQFYTVYQNLVRCLEHLDTQAHIPHKKGKSKDAEIVDKKTQWEHKESQKWEKYRQEQKQKLEQEFNKPQKPVLVQSQEIKEDHSKNNSTSFLTKTWSWIRGIFHGQPKKKSNLNTVAETRFKREETEDEKEEKKEQEEINSKLQEKMDLATRDFTIMLDMLSQIVINACPASYSPSATFAAESVQEITNKVAKDVPNMITAVEYFFIKCGLWTQVRTCAMEATKKKTKKATHTIDSNLVQ